MRNITLLFPFVLLVSLARAQDSLVVQPNSAIVASMRMNELYIGLENPLLISYGQSKKFLVTCDQGKIVKRDDLYYIYDLTTPGACTITLSDLSGRNKRDFKFRVKRVPAPTAFIANQKEGTVNKLLLAAGCIIPILENFDFELYYKTVSFDILITHTNGENSSFSLQGNCLTPEVKEFIAHLQKGDHVLFYNIKCRLATNQELPLIDLNSISLTIQ